MLRIAATDPQGAAPNMLRFLICASLLYIGFAFAGWVSSPFERHERELISLLGDPWPVPLQVLHPDEHQRVSVQVSG